MSRAMIFGLGCVALILVTFVQSSAGQGRYSGVKSADQQCVDMGYSGGLCGGLSSSVCSGLVCADYYRRATYVNRPLDGTGCGNSKVCIDGVCQTSGDGSGQDSPQKEECRARWGPQG